MSKLVIVGNGIWQVDRVRSQDGYVWQVWWLDKGRGSCWQKVGEYGSEAEAFGRTERER